MLKKKKKVSIAENFRDVFVECIAGNPPLTCLSPINMFRVNFVGNYCESLYIKLFVAKFYCSVGQRIELRPGRLSSNFNEVTNIFLMVMCGQKYREPFPFKSIACKKTSAANAVWIFW